jgi:hypothetical protein
VVLNSARQRDSAQRTGTDMTLLGSSRTERRWPAGGTAREAEAPLGIEGKGAMGEMGGVRERGACWKFAKCTVK